MARETTRFCPLLLASTQFEDMLEQRGATGGLAETHSPYDEVAASLVAARLTARTIADHTPDDARLSLARSFCYRVVAMWWERVTAPSYDVRLRPLLEYVDLSEFPPPAAALADKVARAVGACDAETAAYAIGLIYTCMLPQAYRATYGVYYTPPLLTKRLIDRANAAGVDWRRCKVLDPACGGGAFLAPLANRLLAALPDGTPATLVENIATRLKGYEIDPFAAWLSQVTLDAVMLPVCREARRELPVVVTICDSLQRRPPRERFDLVIGNPPYRRVRLTPEERDRFRRSLYGHANLYGLFTDLALRHVRIGGVVAYVTPTSFLAGEYFKRLRGLLGRQAPPVTVDFVGVRKGVFEDVLQETLLATYRRGVAPSPAEVCEVMPSGENRLKTVETGHFLLPEDPSQPWLLPRTIEQAGTIARLRDMPHRLADWGYKVSTGPLVWNRHKSQLRQQPGSGCFPLIWAEAITADGRFVFRAEKRNHQPYFQPTAGDEWLITRVPCVLLQRTTAKEQNRRLIAAALPAPFLADHKAVVIENHLNMLRATSPNPEVPPAVLAAFLNSRAADHVFRCVSGSVAVSAYELEALPVPSPLALSELTRLVHTGADRAQLDAACDTLYARPMEEAA